MYHTFINNFLNHIAMINMTLTAFKFFSTDQTPPRIPTIPLRSPFNLPMDLGHICYYFPGQAPEAPSNTAVMMYLGHTIDFKNLAAHTEEWLRIHNATHGCQQ